MMDEVLDSYGLMIHENNQKYHPIDYAICDADDKEDVAFIWGDSKDKIEYDCEHPIQCVEFDDDEPVGQCMLCGASCDCHYELDEGNVEDYYWSGRRLVPHEWHTPEKPGGVIGKYIKYLKEK